MAALRRRTGTGGLNLTAPYGQVTALVGPNGAGKTTLLLILASLLTPDRGEVRVAGADPATDPAAVRSAMGWMPDSFGVYDQLTVTEYLRFFAKAYRLPRSDVDNRVAQLLTLIHLAEYGLQPVHVLSRGQKQRLALARALIHRPTVLLLDEPASGAGSPVQSGVTRYPAGAGRRRGGGAGVESHPHRAGGDRRSGRGGQAAICGWSASATSTAVP